MIDPTGWRFSGLYVGCSGSPLDLGGVHWGPAPVGGGCPPISGVAGYHWTLFWFVLGCWESQVRYVADGGGVGLNVTYRNRKRELAFLAFLGKRFVVEVYR